MSIDTSRTAISRDLFGRRRRLQLRIGEIGELERLRGAGIGFVLQRVVHLQFYHDDIRETVRLGLEGGGASPTEAQALVMRYVDPAPIGDHAQLAADILQACVMGVPPAETEPGKEQAETDPAISPPSTSPAGSPD